MTGQLRTTLHDRAADLEAWDVDLASIVRDGDRRVRQRRTAIVGGAAVLALAVGLVSLAYAQRSTPVAPADQDAKPLAYAVGSVIHTGDGTMDVGEKVVSFVPTRWGFVFSTPDQSLHQVRNGQVEPVTTFDGHRSQLASPSTPLVAGDDGQITAWWDGTRIQSWPGYRDGMVDAFDKTNSFNAARSWPSNDPPRIQAESDGHLWFWDGQDTWTAEVRPLTTTAGWKDSGFTDGQMIRSAAGDRMLIRVGGGVAVVRANVLPAPNDPGWADWEPGTDLSGVRAQVPDVTDGVLSPDGDHWFAVGTSQLMVFDSTSGDHQEPGHDGFDQVTPYAWLGDDTIAAVASKTTDDQDVSLLTCQVSTNACRVAASDVGTQGDVVVPSGVPSEAH